MFRFLIAWIRSDQILAALLLAALLRCCGGCGPAGDDSGQDGLPDSGLANVETENTAAREATISEEGGTLTATDRNGVVYTLTVPASALAEDTVIGMYPVLDVATLPADAQVAGGVHFVPDGLVLQLGATLTMEFPAGTDLLSLFAVKYDGDGNDPTLSISRADGRTLTVLVQHFSGAIAVGGEDALTALGFESSQGGVAEGYIDRIAQASQGFAGDDPAVTAAVLPIYIEWYEEYVRPTLVFGATTTLDSGIFDETRRVYDEWHSVASMTGILPQLAAQVADATPLAAAYLNKRYEFFNRACAEAQNLGFPITETFGPVAQAAKGLDVGALARQWGVPREPNNLDDEFLLDNLCVQVAFDTLLPDGLDRPGDTGTLTVGTHYTIAGGPARNDLPIRVRLTRDGAAIGSPASGLVDTSGILDSQITWPAGVDPLTIDVLARLDRSGFRRIARFDRLTIGCTPPQVNAVTPLINGRFQFGVFRADVTGTPTTYAWNLGGGATPNTSAEAAPSVTFGEVGNYRGSLTLTSDCASSIVFFFDYEVRAIPFYEYEYVGTVTERFPAFGIDCSGPATASFEIATSSGFPEFQIQYEFNCVGRPNRPTLLFPFNFADITETDFVTRDGLGSGVSVGDHLSFEWANDGGTATFEGERVPE